MNSDQLRMSSFDEITWDVLSEIHKKIFDRWEEEKIDFDEVSIKIPYFVCNETELA